MRIRWKTLDGICRDLAALGEDGSAFWIEDTEGKHVAGRPAYGAEPVDQHQLEVGGATVGRLLIHEPDGPRIGPVLLAACGRELEHQLTVLDMADATARLWRQTNALLRMTSTTDLAIEPAAMLERIISVLHHSTSLARGGGLVRLPGEGLYTCIGVYSGRKLEPDRVRVLENMEDDVRIVTPGREDTHLMDVCELLLHRRDPVAVARLATENDRYGLLLVPAADVDTLKADDLKLIGAAAQILSVAIENAHTLSREREATRLSVENELLSAQARDMEEMLHVVAHDLRSPMTALYGFVHVALDAFESFRERLDGMEEVELIVEGDPIAEPLENGVRSIEKLNRMVQRLLDFSRVARSEYQFEEVDLGQLANSVLEALSFQINERQITIETEELPTVVGDRIHLESVFHNLIDNAIKYMGHPELRAIRVGCYQDGETVYFVEDTGVGMSPNQISKAFLPFRRFRSDAAPGEGIGLSYIRKIIERHGGRIWCESTESVGTTFFFTLSEAPPISDALTSPIYG